MHVISVPDFLSLDEWLPHQDALSAGLLQEYDHEKMDGRVLFVSHQWSSWLHPDPKLEQMNSLKFALGKLLEGKTEVRSNSILEFSYKWNLRHTGAWWKQNLPQTYLWIDYLSMPQPLSARFKGMAKSEVDEAMAEEKRARHAGMGAEGEGEASVGHSGMDHRQVDSSTGSQDAKEEEVARLVGLLVKAVDCIPMYIQRCSMMWVLVPPTSHSDVQGAMCDYTTWRNRGWCRMEFKASTLKAIVNGKSDMPVMVLQVKSGTQPSARLTSPTQSRQY